ncbi:hypothetical protein ACIP5L_11720 [Streptomyces bacillaris]
MKQRCGPEGFFESRKEYDGWNVARTVAVIRTTGPDEAAWLRLWLSSS